jgi:hypothetical protein
MMMTLPWSPSSAVMSIKTFQNQASDRHRSHCAGGLCLGTIDSSTLSNLTTEELRSVMLQHATSKY